MLQSNYKLIIRDSPKYSIAILYRKRYITNYTLIFNIFSFHFNLHLSKDDIGKKSLCNCGYIDILFFINFVYASNKYVSLFDYAYAYLDNSLELHFM